MEFKRTVGKPNFSDHFKKIIKRHEKVGYICWIYLLDFFCSGNQFYLLLSPYLCFISFLYLDLYVLDDVLISKVSFMQTKHLCVFIHN